MKKFIYVLVASSFIFPVFSAEDEYEGIEEVIVTAEKREASIQDTAISITAFDESLIEGLNLRNQEDLQNFIPATTIQPYDISIRGIGRVFRALGGDPGVGTYQDGAYSEDFGIASTENALYDIARIEVLGDLRELCMEEIVLGGRLILLVTNLLKNFLQSLRPLPEVMVLQKFILLLMVR